MYSLLRQTYIRHKDMKVCIVFSGHEFPMDVSIQEPVLEIKRKVESTLCIPVASQNLSVCGWELIDGLDLGDYPILSEGTKIHLTTKCTQNSLDHSSNRKMIVTVKFSARKIDLEVDETETVKSLKEKIHIVDGTPIKRMTLFFSGREMDEEFRGLSEYGISEFSEIIVFLKTMSRVTADPPSRKLGIVVQTSSCLLNAARIPIEMNDTSTIEELKKSLLDRKILPVDDYIFIHKQRLMRENCSLRWHGVENGDFLYVFRGTVAREGP